MHTDDEFRRLCVSQSTKLYRFSHFNSSHNQTKTPIIMANNDIMNVEGSNKCLRFGDGTRPLCHVSGQLGHLC